MCVFNLSNVSSVPRLESLFIYSLASFLPIRGKKWKGVEYIEKKKVYMNKEWCVIIRTTTSPHHYHSSLGDFLHGQLLHPSSLSPFLFITPCWCLYCRQTHGKCIWFSFFMIPSGCWWCPTLLSDISFSPCFLSKKECTYILLINSISWVLTEWQRREWRKTETFSHFQQYSIFFLGVNEIEIVVEGEEKERKRLHAFTCVCERWSEGDQMRWEYKKQVRKRRIVCNEV